MKSEGLVGDAMLELAKAKELASVMGGAWHAQEEDVDTDKEGEEGSAKKTKKPSEQVPSNGDMNNNNHSSSGGVFSIFVPNTLRRSVSGCYYGPKSYNDGNGSTNNDHDKANNDQRQHINPNSAHSSNTTRSSSYRGRRGASIPGGNGVVRRPADGKAPGREDPVAAARAEAAAKLAKAAAMEADRMGEDPAWQLPTNVDYYTDRAALLRELVKGMPAEKRLSFQTRVANARTKEAVESLLQDFAPRLECLALPHARSREVDLLQVKKDTARERVFLDGKEMAFWGSPSDQPHSWHEELWASVETRVMEGLLRGEDIGGSGGGGSGRGGEVKEGRDDISVDEEVKEEIVVDKARALASEEWNKARAVATTSEVFKAMSRTGAGGDAYFALVALFCTADKMVVPVHCQESPITVEFHQPISGDGDSNNSNMVSKPKGLFGGGSGGGGSWGSWHEHGSSSSPACSTSRKTSGSSTSRHLRGSVGAAGGGGGAAGGVAGAGKGEENVHVVVTVPSTFDIYLRDGVGHGSNGSNGSNYGANGNNRRNATTNNGSSGRPTSIDAHGGADASIALHLVRVRAVVEEEIRVVGSSRLPASAESFCDETGSSSSSSASVAARGNSSGGGRRLNSPPPPSLQFLLNSGNNSTGGGGCNRRSSAGGADGGCRLVARRASSAPSEKGVLGDAAGHRRAAGNGHHAGGAFSEGGDGSPMTPPPPAPAPLLTLTRTERRMRVTVVPEPSTMSEMVRQISRKIGVGVRGAEPPRILGL